MGATISVFDLPVVANTATPILHNAKQVGSYGTSVDDVVIPDAEFAVLKALPLNPPHPVIKFKVDPAPWNRNPIDRDDLVNPVKIPAGAIVTNRNLLMQMLNIFLLPRNHGSHRDVEFQVSSKGNIIYFGSLHQEPGPVVDASYDPERQGVPFEELIATTADPNLRKYFVFQSYSLLGASQLLVRSEVNCVSQNNKITMIKTRYAPKHSLWGDVGYFKTVWAQMLFGCAETLVVGLKTPIEPAADGTQQVQFDIATRTFEEVAVLAKMDTEERYMPCFKSLVNLIEWIRANIADGENKKFSYSKRDQQFSLS